MVGDGMILYESSLDMRFPDYGILIPVMDSRAKRVLSFLGAPSTEVPVIGGLYGAAEVLGIPPEELSVGRSDLQRVHEGAFVGRLFGDGEAGRGGLERALLETYELVDERGRYRRYEPHRAKRPLADLFDTVLRQVSGTYAACRLALAAASAGVSAAGTAQPASFCYFLGGGMHHARYASGAGFCPVNDIMIAAARLIAEGRARCIWVIDVDAHKGDGTAELAARERTRGCGTPERAQSDGRVLTLSIHMAEGWPLDRETLSRSTAGRAPLVPSDVELPIARGAEADYLPRLAAGLSELERLSAGAAPDLAVVVDGADPYEKDGLPSSADLALSLEECVERDLIVYRFLSERGIPSAWLMAGGYGERAWEPPAHFLKEVFYT